MGDLPEEKTVVLGLVSTKSARLEDPAAIETRVREAARRVPLDHLALSTQCGFSSSIVGNRLGIEDEKQKLRLVAQMAERIWG